MDPIPSTQRAWVATRRGTPPYALRFVENHPVPSDLKNGEVLLKVQAAALNPSGYKLLRLLPWIIARYPHVPEYDLAGTVVRSTVAEFAPGDQVFGWIPTTLNISTKQGALSEYTRIPATHIVHRPNGITPVQAAGVALVALTAWDALFVVGKVESGQRIFVNGGSTAVGSWAIMLAKAKGCVVTATASARNEAYVKGLGADEFIDYTAAPLAPYLASNPPAQKYHVIFDAAGLNNPDLYTHSPAYLVPNGIFISSIGGPKSLSWRELWDGLRNVWWCFLWPGWAGGVRRRFRLVLVKNGKDKLLAIKDHIEKQPDIFRPLVDSVFAFSETLKAYERIQSGRATGKVVIRVEDGVN